MSSEDEKTTKVYYYLDGSTPFVSIIPVPTEKITLGDFKKVFEKHNYKYFCKEFDPDLNKEVKVELTKNDQKLNKSQNGLIQLVLLPIYPQTTTAAGNTLPRSLKYNSGDQGTIKLKKRASAQALSSITDEADFVAHRVSLATDPSAFTSFSRRAGEHLADVFSSDEEDDPILAGSNESSNYGTSTDSLKHGRKNRDQKAYVPSTISSATHSSSHSASLPRLDEIKISMNNASCLGIQVVDADGGIFVSNIKGGSAADQCGLLEIGDQICQINNVSFEYLTIQQAVAELQKVARSKRTITMFVAKRPNISDQKSDGLSGTLEATMPLDISGWVETTKKEPTNHSFKDSETFNINYIDDGGITSDEERAAYIDRRNGAGNILVSALTNFRNNNSFEPSLPNFPIPSMKKDNDENELFCIPLTVDSDPTVILRKMVHPKSSLEIADRKWLKIPFPNSFIGNDLIHWLLQNVSGFKNKKEAVNFGNMLLSKGYIRHVLDGKQFDKKRYYFFDDSIIAYRKQIEQYQRQNNIKSVAGMGSATTEITYLGSPTYPPHLLHQQTRKPQTNLKSIPASCGILPEPSQHQFIPTQNSYQTEIRNPTRITQSQPRLLPSTSNRSPFYPLPPMQPSPRAPIQWPISPVFKRACDSPQTNDYASMIQGEINSNYIPIPLPTSNNMDRAASPPPNTPNTLSANSSTALLTIAPKFHR